MPKIAKFSYFTELTAKMSCSFNRFAMKTETSLPRQYGQPYGILNCYNVMPQQYILFAIFCSMKYRQLHIAS